MALPLLMNNGSQKKETLPLRTVRTAHQINATLHKMTLMDTSIIVRPCADVPLTGAATDAYASVAVENVDKGNT